MRGVADERARHMLMIAMVTTPVLGNLQTDSDDSDATAQRKRELKRKDREQRLSAAAQGKPPPSAHAPHLLLQRTRTRL